MIQKKELELKGLECELKAEMLLNELKKDKIANVYVKTKFLTIENGVLTVKFIIKEDFCYIAGLVEYKLFKINGRTSRTNSRIN